MQHRIWTFLNRDQIKLPPHVETSGRSPLITRGKNHLSAIQNSSHCFFFSVLFPIAPLHIPISSANLVYPLGPEHLHLHTVAGSDIVTHS